MALKLDLQEFRYPGRPPLFQAVRLELAPGELVGLVGGSGSGKSTLLGLLAGLHPQPLGGNFLGQRSFETNETEIGVGYLASDPTTFLTGFCESVLEEVGWSLFGEGWSPEQVEVRVEETLARFSLQELRDRHPAALSGGQAQMVALAAVWARRPRWLLLDEPASRLDPVATEALREAVVALAREDGVGVVWATADLGQVAPFVGTVWSLDQPPLNSVAAGDWTVEGSEAVWPWPLQWAQKEARPLPRWTSAAPPPRPSPFAAGEVPAKPPLVQVSGLCYRPEGGEGALFEGMDWTLDSGQVVGLAGPNGAGKTTLARLLRGLLPADSGRLEIAGREISTDQVAALASTVAYTFQTPSDLFLRWRVDAELAYSAQLLGLPAEQARARVGEALELFGLGEFADWHPRELPASPASLLGVALSWMGPARLQILDEPLARLDRSGRERLDQVLRAWRSRGVAVLVIAHDLDWLCSVCQRVLVLDRGRPVGEGEPLSLFASAPIRSLLGIPWALRTPS